MNTSLVVENADALSAYVDLASEDLHDKIIVTYIAIGNLALEYQGLYLEARTRLDAGQELGGCNTWTAYASTYFKKADETLPTCLRRLRRALEGVNPATDKYKNKSIELTPEAEPEVAPAITKPTAKFKNPAVDELARLRKKFPRRRIERVGGAIDGFDMASFQVWAEVDASKAPKSKKKITVQLTSEQLRSVKGQVTVGANNLTAREAEEFLESWE